MSPVMQSPVVNGTSAIMIRCVVAAIVLLTSAVALGSPAGAENPSELGNDLAADSVYVGPGRVDDVDEATVLPAIERARDRGLTVYVLWPDEPQPNTDAFARRIQELYEVDVALVFGPEGELGSFVSEDYADNGVRALSAARAANGPGPAVDAFVIGLVEEPERERPAILNTLVRWVAILVGILVAAAVGEQMIRQYKRSRQRRELERLRAD